MLDFSGKMQCDLPHIVVFSKYKTIVDSSLKCSICHAEIFFDDTKNISRNIANIHLQNKLRTVWVVHVYSIYTYKVINYISHITRVKKFSVCVTLRIRELSRHIFL